MSIVLTLPSASGSLERWTIDGCEWRGFSIFSGKGRKRENLLRAACINMNGLNEDRGCRSIQEGKVRHVKFLMT